MTTHHGDVDEALRRLSRIVAAAEEAECAEAVRPMACSAWSAGGHFFALPGVRDTVDFGSRLLAT